MSDYPAFPNEELFSQMNKYVGSEEALKYIGLSKRECFAALALMGLCTRGALTPDERIEFAVNHADRLVEKLQEKK